MEALALIESQSMQIVVRGDQAEFLAASFPGGGLRCADQRASDTLFLLQTQQRQDFTLFTSDLIVQETCDFIRLYGFEAF